jgi:hypothetical protein
VAERVVADVVILVGPRPAALRSDVLQSLRLVVILAGAESPTLR